MLGFHQKTKLVNFYDHSCFYNLLVKIKWKRKYDGRNRFSFIFFLWSWVELKCCMRIQGVRNRRLELNVYNSLAHLISLPKKCFRVDDYVSYNGCTTILSICPICPNICKYLLVFFMSNLIVWLCVVILYNRDANYSDEKS